MLSTRDLCSGYGRVTVLHDVDFRVNDGEVVAVLGPNGAGKSTLMKTIAGVLPVASGGIWFDGVDRRHWTSYDASTHGIGYVPQEGNVFAGLTVAENLRIGAARHGARAGDEIEEAVEHLPILRERMQQRAGTLSGGQRQQLAIASALLMKPRLLLLDEPTTGLAPKIVDEVSQWVSTIAAGGMTTVWVVEQNPEVALNLATRAYVIGDGQVVREAPAHEISSEMLEQLLIGERG